jgi:hypothetical protein
MVQNSSKIRIIDITHAARPWRWVRLADYVMVILCTYMMIPLIISEITGPYSISGSLVIMPLIIAIIALNLYSGWAIMGTISLRHHWTATFALLLLVPVGFLAWFGVVKNLQAAGTDNEAVIKSGIAVGIFLVFGALAGIVGLLRIRWSKIRDLKMSLKDFLAETERVRREQPPPARLPPRDRTRGLISGFGGVGILSGLAALPEVAGSYAAPLGWYLLLRCRAYFQPDFEHLLAADLRRPIIFLRSFADDQVVRYLVSERTFIDFSLEARLANYFHDFGPFIAVGSTLKQKHSLELGAARVQLSDAEWQAKVLNWMQTSSVIVLFAGITPWVNWELKEAITGNHANKLLVIFPGSRRRHWWQRGPSDAERQLDAVRQDLADTAWSAALNRLDHPKTVRVITFAPSGDITVIRSRTRIRDSYHLAAMVGHFLLLQGAQVP